MGEPSEVTPPSSRESSTPPSYPEPQQISTHTTLQAPLSRRGKGPGLILILNAYASIEKSEKHLDPPPLQKWAEEGFAVVQLLVPGKVEDGGEFPLKRALEILRGCEACEYEKGVGLICKSLFSLYLRRAGQRPSPNMNVKELGTTNCET
jgi:carboxymethylenebutenolidase